MGCHSTNKQFSIDSFLNGEKQHCRAISAAVRDHKSTIPQAVLDFISKRAPPRQWANTTWASKAIGLINTSGTRISQN